MSGKGDAPREKEGIWMKGSDPEDECIAAGGCAGGDQEFSIPIADECYPGDSDDTCTLPSNDNAE